MPTKHKAPAKRSRRTSEQRIADLEAQIEELRARSKLQKKFSPEEVHADRERLELSAADYGELVGVSALTVYNWEKGKTKPQQAQREKLEAVMGVRKEVAWQQLGIESEFSPEAVAEERDRLQLSAADYGQLVGVSGLTIYNWEKGKSRPQAKQLDKWLGVNGIGKRKAWKRLGV